jgi:hypothetical protein
VGIVAAVHAGNADAPLWDAAGVQFDEALAVFLQNDDVVRAITGTQETRITIAEHRLEKPRTGVYWRDLCILRSYPCATPVKNAKT